MNYQMTKAKGIEARTKVIRGWKRFQLFAHATSLAVLVCYAGTNDYADLRTGDKDIATIVLTVATVLIGLTALVLYVKFFTEEA